MEFADANITSNIQVQHVTKKSSDELLRKFAELEDDDGGDKGTAPRKELRLVVKRRKKSGGSTVVRRKEADFSQCESPNSSKGLMERKWLLPPAATTTRRSTLLRQLGIGRSQLRAREIRNRSLFGTIEKTWRRTIEGASKVFMEKHYNRHRRLINDVV